MKYFCKLLVLFLLSGCTSPATQLIKGDYDGMIAKYGKYMETNDGVTNYQIAEAYRLSNRIKNAEPFYASALKLGIDQDDAYYYYARSLKANQKYDDAPEVLSNALYKVKSSSLFEERHIQNIIKSSHATIVTVSPEFFVIELTGFREETEKLRKDLEPYGLLQFVRSGRISVTKAKMGISEILNTFKKNN